MTPTALRFGILGVARINDRLVPAFHKTPHAELHAIASRRLDRAQAAAAAAGIPRAHGSYDELLADPDIDAVYIPLPNTEHAHWACRAADAGKHVLCEKPLAPTAPEAQEVVEYCRAKGVVLMDGFMWPHHPRTARIREVIDRGTIGVVQHVAGTFTFRLPMDPGNIRLRPETAGGSLLDVGCYPVYGIRWAFAEEPVRVQARARYQNEVDVAMSGLVWLADGRVGAFDCGFTTPLRQWLEITGTEGVIRVEDMWLPDEQAAFTILREGRTAEVVTTPGHDQIACMLEDFAGAVRQGELIRREADEAVRTLLVLDALAQSAAEEREMEV